MNLVALAVLSNKTLRGEMLMTPVSIRRTIVTLSLVFFATTALVCIKAVNSELCKQYFLNVLAVKDLVFSKQTKEGNKEEKSADVDHIERARFGLNIDEIKELVRRRDYVSERITAGGEVEDELEYYRR